MGPQRGEEREERRGKESRVEERRGGVKEERSKVGGKKLRGCWEAES